MKKRHFIIKLILELEYRYRNHNITAYAAQLAYFIMLSIFPFLIFLFSILGRFSIDSERILKAFLIIMPPDSALIINNYIEEMIRIDTDAITPFFGLATLLAASRGVNALMRALNIAYGVKENRGFFRMKLIGTVYTLLFIFSVVATAIISIMGIGFSNQIRKYFHIPSYLKILFSNFRWLLLMGLIVVVILGIYKALPNRKLKVGDIIYGTVFSIFGWIVMSLLFSYFVNNFSNYSLIYGSLAAIIILMIWLYLTAIIVIIGGEINSIFLDGFMRP